MSNDIFGAMPTWAVFLLTLVIVSVAMELGHRFKARTLGDGDSQETPSSGVAIGALLGLVSFLLAFTFGIAASHYDERKATVLEDANAIGTAYLRADLLPPEEGQRVADLLHEYAEIRLVAASSRFEKEFFLETVARSEEIHNELWSIVVSVAVQEKSANTALVVSAVNEVIDTHTKRVTAGVRNRIPATIWFSLYLVAAIGIASASYRITEVTSKRSELLPGLALTFASVITLISDLDDPRHGFLLVDQAPMQATLDSMNAAQ